ncbi:hypothetical protein HUU53_02725 [Candidatus Micrarchaeota archaeon]|nr:hypothetical protein [Candidatus Micrarchaeota archaeon]
MKIGFLVLAALFLFGCVSQQASQEQDFELSGNAIVYKSPTCGCCEGYINFLKETGFKVEVKQAPHIESIKREHNIPQKLESCHTTFIGDYFVEGHVPKEALEKLMKEKPKIKGIALPGMPIGTPGMPGPKQEEWIIYSLNYDDSYSIFMRV